MKLTVSEAAALLDVPEPEVYGWIRDRELPHVRVQDRYFLNRDQLFQWAHDHHVRLHPDVFGNAVHTCVNALADAIHNGGVHRCPAPLGPDEAALMLVALLGLPASVHVGAVSAIVAARPQLGFALDAGGVALPRICEPILAPTPAALTLFVFDAPWQLEKTSIDRAFMIVAPTVAEHHCLLAALEAALHDLDFRAAVARGDAREPLEALVRQNGIAVLAAAK